MEFAAPERLLAPAIDADMPDDDRASLMELFKTVLRPHVFARDIPYDEKGPAALPPDWMAIRDRWEVYHGLRTLVSLAALACLFVSTLSTGWRSAPDRQAQRDAPREIMVHSRVTAGMQTRMRSTAGVDLEHRFDLRAGRPNEDLLSERERVSDEPATELRPFVNLIEREHDLVSRLQGWIRQDEGILAQMNGSTTEARS